jgi:peptidoglycan/LPS O-acetylase OafA/YrhL
MNSQTTGERRVRNRVYAFACLVLGIAVLFSLFFGGLYNESVPMLLACAVLLYFLPVLIAAARLKHNGAAVVRLNALRGWTGVGWIQAMKQALAEDD